MRGVWLDGVGIDKETTGLDAMGGALKGWLAAYEEAHSPKENPFVSVLPRHGRGLGA